MHVHIEDNAMLNNTTAGFGQSLQWPVGAVA